VKWHSRPKTGDVRVRDKFLLFPKTIDGETRWMERAKWVEHYGQNGGNVIGRCYIPTYGWEPSVWGEVDSKPAYYLPITPPPPPPRGGSGVPLSLHEQLRAAMKREAEVAKNVDEAIAKMRK